MNEPEDNVDNNLSIYLNSEQCNRLKLDYWDAEAGKRAEIKVSDLVGLHGDGCNSSQRQVLGTIMTAGAPTAVLIAQEIPGWFDIEV